MASAAAGSGLADYCVTDIPSWADCLGRAAHALNHGEALWVWETPHSEFFVPSEILEVSEHASAVARGRGWSLKVPAGASGQPLIGEQVVPWRTHGGPVELTEGMRVRLMLGALTFLLSCARAPKPVRATLGQRLHPQELGTFARSRMLHAGLMGLLVVRPPDGEIQIRRGCEPILARLVSVESVQSDAREEPKEDPIVDELPEPFETPTEVVRRDSRSPVLRFLPEPEPRVELDVRPQPPDSNRDLVRKGPDSKPDSRSEIARVRVKRMAERYIPTE